MSEISIETLAVSPVLVTVGDVDITEAMIAEEMQHHPAPTLKAAGDAATRTLVIRELLFQRARIVGQVAPDVREPCEDDISRLLDKELDVPRAGEDEHYRFYLNACERYREPPSIHVSHILLAAFHDEAEESQRIREKGVSLLALLQDTPERFEELAQRYSSCPSREQGGDLGWISRGQTVEEFERALSHLPEGLHDQPIRTRYGWHLVTVHCKREGRRIAYDQVKDRVVHDLYEAATRTAFHHYMLALADDIGVVGYSLGREN